MTIIDIIIPCKTLQWTWLEDKLFQQVQKGQKIQMLQKLLKVKKPWRIGKQSLKTKTLQDEFNDQRRFKSLQFSHYADVEWCSFEKEQFWDGSSVFISRECLCGNVANVYAEMLRLQMGVYCKLDGAPSHKLCTNQQWKVKKEFGFFSQKL